MRRRKPAPAPSTGEELTAAEVQRLYDLAGLFEVDGLNEHTAPYAVVAAVAEVAGGPVEDFSGPMGKPMPLELWSDALLSEVPYSAPVADRLVAAVEHYRASSPPPAPPLTAGAGGEKGIPEAVGSERALRPEVSRRGGLGVVPHLAEPAPERKAPS